MGGMKEAGKGPGRRRSGRRRLKRGNDADGGGLEISWRQKLANTLELPKDVVLDLPRITILGDLQVTIENHRGIIQYTSEQVLVGMSKGRILVTGEDLVIGVIHEEEMTVTGLLETIAFLRIG